MANVNRANGLSPVQYLNGAPWNGQARLYSVATAFALAIGDPVDLSGTADANGVPGVVLATSGTTHPLVGVVVGVGDYEGTTVNISNPNVVARTTASPTAGYVMVADDPLLLFEVGENAAGTAFAATDIGSNACLLVGTPGTTYSTCTVDSGTAPTTTVGYQVQLMGLIRRPGNAFGAYARWLVRINNHRYNQGLTSI